MVEYLCGGRVTNYKDRSRSFETDVLEASHFWKHDGLEARRLGRMTFLQHEVFHETLYQWNIILKTLEAGRKSSRMGSKHDGKAQNWTKP
ncbi:hypothetical protein Bca101_071553 [Brassica carinata]